MNKFENNISENELKNLQWLSNFIFDSISYSIPESPKLCVNSFGNFKIFDNDTIQNQLKSDKNYKDIINSIDNSGISGVGYILNNLPDYDGVLFEILDKILISWHNNIVIDLITENDEELLQLLLSDHEWILRDIDNFFILQIKSILPEILQIPFNQISIQLSLMDREDVISKLNLNDLKNAALKKIKYNINNNYSDFLWLLKYENSDYSVINLHDLELLVEHYINIMHNNAWKDCVDDKLFLFSNHLQMRREHQVQIRSNAQGSLKTNPVNDEETHILADNEIRDPISRNHYIDINNIECAKDFRDISIAANIVANAGYNIKSIKDTMNFRSSLRESLFEKYRHAREQKITYIPSVDELEAARLENIDEFINNQFIEHGDTYLISALSKLKKFLENKPIISSATQLDILKKYSFDSLKAINKVKNYSNEIHFYNTRSKTKNTNPENTEIALKKARVF